MEGQNQILQPRDHRHGLQAPEGTLQMVMEHPSHHQLSQVCVLACGSLIQILQTWILLMHCSKVLHITQLLMMIMAMGFQILR